MDMPLAEISWPRSGSIGYHWHSQSWGSFNRQWLGNESFASEIQGVQSDWFGKRGLYWHMSIVYRRIEGELQWQGFIHVIQSCSQGSSAVAAIMHHVLATLKCEHPEVNKAYFRQDNAGCYHSSHMILACREISASTGVQVVRIDSV